MASDITAGKHFKMYFAGIGDACFGTNFNPNIMCMYQLQNAANGGPFKLNCGLNIQLIDEP